MERTPLKQFGLAIYRGDLKIAQVLDYSTEELFGSNILPRAEDRYLLEQVTYDEAAMNCASIVKACNSYASLLAQNKALKEALEALLACPDFRDTENYATVQARAALAESK